MNPYIKGVGFKKYICMDCTKDPYEAEEMFKNHRKPTGPPPSRPSALPISGNGNKRR